MADQQSQYANLDDTLLPGSEAEGNKPDDSLLAKIQRLPKPAQFGIIAVVVIVVFLMFSGGAKQKPTANNGGAVNVTTRAALENNTADEGDFFSSGEEREALIQSFFEQSRREIADMRDEIQEQFNERDKALAETLTQSAELQQEIRQIIADFTTEIKQMEQTNQSDREVLNRIAEETRELQNQANGGAAIGVNEGTPLTTRRERMSQTPLSLGANVGRGNALLSPAIKAVDGGSDQVRGLSDIDNVNADERLPFVPPLGFIKATMLNGVDALVGGQSTPSLVRLSGVYKTAMNSTVNLDGCFALVEFSGDVSTERAIGKPSRMTCVYPDQGAVSYSVSGYVVDALDGIIGVPGVFYEGDASRIAVALLADFAAGLTEVIEANQNTKVVTTDAAGNISERLITSDDVETQIASGANNAVSSLRDYLFERANRVLPFIRIDATRDISMVLLSGVELRDQGNAWTLLFDAENEY